MAGGGGSGNEGASLDDAKLRQRRHCRPSDKPASLLSQAFVRRRDFERERTCLLIVQTLERDILRIFTNRRHSDFYIIHGCSIIETHSCILKTRSPKLYETLETRFVHSNNAIKCYVETPYIFQRFKHFSRLLYTNLDIEREECALVQLFSSLKHDKFLLSESLSEDCTFFPKTRTCEDTRYVNFHLIDDTRGKREEDGAERVNPGSISDMADSGLETGSLSPLENTDNSVTDLEESHGGTDYVSMDDDFVNVGPNGEVEESCGKRHSIIAASSSFRDLSMSNDDRRVGYGDAKKNCTVIIPGDSLGKNIDFRVPSEINDPALKESFSGGASSYYFIDASSLNDDNVGNDDDDDKNGNWTVYSSTRGDYVPTRNSSGNREEQSSNYRLTTRRLSSLESGHERVAEFERELKMTEYLRPMREPRKVKRVDSTNDEKSESCLEKTSSIEKETLVVEIKEADSGESAHPSPCTDNTGAEVANETTAGNSEQQPPSLIRRNTFELDSNDEKLSVLRQEYERRQGHLLFQSCIPQYSGHRVDGDSCFEPSNSSHPVVALKYSTVTTGLGKTDRRPVDPSNDDDETRSSERSLTSRESPEETIPSSRSSDRDSGRVVVVDRHGRHRDTVNEKSFVESCSESDDGSRNCCNSLPITLNEPQLPRERRSSINWIPSLGGGGEGGASGKSDSRSKPNESLIVGRKIQSTLTVSDVGGGGLLTNDDEPLGTTRMASSTTAAWIVDMSDCGKNCWTKTPNNTRAAVSRSFSSSSSSSHTDRTNDKNPKRTKSGETTKYGSLGFFVNLDEIDKDEKQREDERRKLTAENGKHSCEFFVDMSKESEEKEPISEKCQNSRSDGRKNIFSMFIDLKEPSNENSNDGDGGDNDDVNDNQEQRQDDDDVLGSSRSYEEKRREQLSQGESSSDKGKPSVFMFIESDSPIVRRRALSSTRPPAFQRHSWNVAEKPGSRGNGILPEKDSIAATKREHKRAHSVSVDRTDLRKLRTKSSDSSHSLSQVARADTLNGGGGFMKRSNGGSGGGRESGGRNTDASTDEAFEYDARDTPPNSHVEILVNPEELAFPRDTVKNIATEHLLGRDDLFEDTKIYEDECSEVSVWDKTGTESTTDGNTRKSETFDISSGGSGPSPESDNRDFHLEDLGGGEATASSNRNEISQLEADRIISDKSLTETIKKIESELNKSEYEDSEMTTKTTTATATIKACSSSFVRLSDLDKTPSHSRASAEAITTGADRINYRMSNSIPETSWIESKLVVNRNNPPVRTLPRKFTTIMSTSLPAKHKSPIQDAAECEGEGVISESDMSSLQSSMGRSGADVSTEDTETWSMGVTRPYNRLGEDLLRMFLEEINPDVTIDVAGRKIQAHKCILSSRCQYFAAILSGGWIESAGNVISLQGYSYNAVHFALCHIYSGESNIPETLSIVELATLADMLCLEGLKEVIGYTLKVKYCHLFHKPCQVCAVGVLECMPLAAAYGLDEVYRKSLRWITRHFVRIWPCKAFATLPRELMDKCYHQHIVHMSTDNVLQTMMDCDKLLATLPNVRWTEAVFRMVSNLLETSVKYISENFSGVLGNENFQALGRDLTWNISRLEDNFFAAADRLPPDQACKSYSKLNKMLSSPAATNAIPPNVAAATLPVTQEPQRTKPAAWCPLFVDFLRKIQTRVEKCLVKEASRAARTTSWLKMDLELRRRIQELACLVILPQDSFKRPSRRSNFLKEPRVPSSNRAPAGSSLDLRRVKMAMSEHNNKTTKQATTNSAPGTTQQVKKPLLVKPKSDPLERKIAQEEKQVTTVAGDSVALRPKSWPNKLEVKSRYLEPRNKSVTKETGQQHERLIVQQRRKIMISSSDSSRTSSPAMKRAVDKKPLAKIKLTIKKDVKALSSDSLAEPTGSLRSTTKKDVTATSKSCGITRPESPSLEQKDLDIGLSADSLAEPRKKNKPQQQPQPPQRTAVTKKKQQTGKITDTWMSTDSLMTEIGNTPKSSNQSSKVSPTLATRTAAGGVAIKTLVYDRANKKCSPPMQQKSPLTTGRRLPRSLECSTAASRNRAAAISTTYHGSPNLRRNLLDAAKTPDVPAKTANGLVTRSTLSTAAGQSCWTAKKDKIPLSNQPSAESPSKRSSPKSNSSAHRTNRVTTSTPAKRPPLRGIEDKTRNKCHNGDAVKQPTVGSRSGTFLKDEPTILKKSDVKTTRISGS